MQCLQISKDFRGSVGEKFFCGLLVDVSNLSPNWFYICLYYCILATEYCSKIVTILLATLI